MFENRVLKKMLGPKRDEVTGEWSRLHFEEFTNQQILFEQSNKGDCKMGREFGMYGREVRRI